MRNINKILENGDRGELYDCLAKAKELAKAGLVIELMDHLVPEDAMARTVMDGKRKRIIRG